jgi:hypothetical protein
MTVKLKVNFVSHCNRIRSGKCAGHTYGHASVIIGVDKSGIIYHDPENAPNSRMPISRFNTVR